jgi:UDP-N-acetylmuramoyl-tripeptide--D-alanyl-D-alanine ligase
MIGISTFILVYLAYLAFSAKRLLTYMHILQQEDYYTERLFKWIVLNLAFDKRLSLSLIVLNLLFVSLPVFTHSSGLPLFVMHFLLFTCFVLAAYLEQDPRKNSKKKLVLTKRAMRIFWPALGILALAAFPAFLLSSSWIWLICVQLIPFVLILSVFITQPFEDAIQLSFWTQAHNKVMDLQPQIIGITGSFGKTSVKHILGHILKTQAPTLVTPGSVNTPMGITRIIREELEPTHKYLVVEMGAYGPGSIERICRLTPPNLGVITAVGHAHYERFKSLDAVAKTKYELAQAVLAKEGTVIAHEKTLRFDTARAIKNQNAASFIICGEAPEPRKDRKNADEGADKKEQSYLEKDDLRIERIEQALSGLTVEVSWKDEFHVLEAPLYGLHHGHNMALAFAAARALDIPAEDIITALKSTPQIQHRLEVKPQPDGTVYIDDAYNSNPIGFQSALNLLVTLQKSGRKILITPGMVELGATHDDAHEKIGQSAGEVCDVAIVINGKRIPSFIEGFKKTANGKTLHEMETIREALEWVHNNKKPGDIILIENDLPDLYEKVPKF